jgi:hypothetical protein
MAKLVTHKFVSSIPDGDDTGLVRPSNWNDTHDVSGVAESGTNTDITSMTGITGGISSPNFVQFDTTAAESSAVGKLFWDDGDGVLSNGLKGGNVTLQIGTQEFARVYNDSGTTLTKGQAVYISGAQGNRVAVKLARADVEATSFGTIGLVAETMTNGAEGFIIVSGALYKLDTLGLVAGATVYLSPITAGALTTTKPQAPQQLVVVGWVERVHATVGSIYVKVDNGYELDELHDVKIVSPTTGQTLVYDQPTGVWNNSNAPLFTTIEIATSGTDAEISPNTGITGWNYSGLSKSVSGEESAPTGLFLSPDGLNMYVNGTTGDDVNQYTLSTAWDVSTATFVRLFSTAAQDSAPADVFFKPDGLSMFILGNTNDTVFQYTLSSAFDISTASYASKSFSVTTQDATPQGFWFKTDGTVMYVVGTSTDTVYQYTLGTAWDVSTASYASISFSVASQEGTPNQVNLSADGLTMWILGATGDDISEYTLGTAWNVGTATFVNSFYVGFQDTGPNGLFIDSTAANRVYFVGQTNDAVFQYNTATNSISAVTDVFNTTSNARVQGNLAVQSNAYVDGAVIVQGTATFGGASTFGSTFTSTSTSSLGTGTGSFTAAVANGATVSGSTKTVNIGTAGLSGSTTAITIGSAVSGSLGTTTIQAPTVNIGQTATQLQVTNTASAVNYHTFTGTVAGFGPVHSVAGTDTNIPLVLQPKGTGALQAQQTDSTATGGNVRGSYAVDWQTSRNGATRVASGAYAVVAGGYANLSSGSYSSIAGGYANTSTGGQGFIGAGENNTASGYDSAVVSGGFNTSAGYYNLIGGGFTNSGTSGSAVTTQSGTMNATTAVTLSGSNANIKVGQYITGTSISGDTYVAAISGTSLTLSKNASGSSTSTLSFFTPHGVVVGGGNNQATGSYSFIGGGGDAGTAANRNVASGDWSFVGGGWKNTASGLFGGALSGTNNTASGIASVVCGGGSFGSITQVSGNTASGLASFVGSGFSNVSSSNGSFVGAGAVNTSNGIYSAVVAGNNGTTRSIWGNHVIPALNPFSSPQGSAQSATLVLGVQTTDATATALTGTGGAASTTNQVILPNNSAYFFTGEVVSGVTGGGNTKGWTIEGVIKRGANAASTALVGTPTVTSMYADVGAATWAIAVTADTTNGGIRVTFTGQASTTIRTVCQIRTTEMTY